MRMYRRYALGAALVALVMTGVACGSGGSGNGTVAGKLVFGAPPDCPTNPFCQVGLKDVYGIEFKEVKTLDFGGPLTINGLKSGAIQVGELFSSSIYDPDFVVLVDDKNLEAADNLVPLIRADKDSPDIDTILNAVMAALTTDKLLALNKQYDVDKTDAAAIAQSFISDAGLSAAPGTGSGKSLTIGVSAGFNEQFILAETFKILLEQAGYTVNTEENLESRKVSDPALFNGDIDIKVEYLASESIQNDASAKVSGDPQNNLDILTALMQAKGVNVLDFSPASDQNVFVVTKATADQYGLSKVSDLAKSA
jgi:glycine betaine/choline ABC-type transport system substrate-binding protein